MNNEDFEFKKKENEYKCKSKILQKALLIPKYARKGVNIVVNNIDRAIIDYELDTVTFYNRKDDSNIIINLKNMRDIEFEKEVNQ